MSRSDDPAFELLCVGGGQVSYAKGDIIFKRGETSRELLFLLSGEVDVMSRKNLGVVERTLTPTEEIFVEANANNGPEDPPLAINHAGCFGETVITGSRRTHTHVAKTTCETGTHSAHSPPLSPVPSAH